MELDDLPDLIVLIVQPEGAPERMVAFTMPKRRATLMEQTFVMPPQH